MVGHYPVIWQYQKTMLDELPRVVPNISPSVRIIGGFSNGGHTIAGNMQFPHTDMPDYFTIYVFADGGGVGSEVSHGAAAQARPSARFSRAVTRACSGVKRVRAS